MDDADTPVQLSKQLNQVIITMTALLECLITFCKLIATPINLLLHAYYYSHKEIL